MKKRLPFLCLSLLPLSLLFACGSSQEATYPGYYLLWSDEFEGESLDTDYWTYETGGGGWGNGELEYYTEKNATVNDGVLIITAKREEVNDSSTTYEYTSSRIKTAKKAYTTYGRIEARIKLDAQIAMWPAFWMMPEANNGWPTSGEIDIMEARGSDAYTTSSALHYSDSNGNHAYQSGAYEFSKRTEDTTIEDWHLYYVLWDEEGFSFYVDDHQKLYVPKRAWHPSGGSTYSTDDDAPFNKDFYVILNMAVGGNFDSNYSEPLSTFTEAHMQIDYVRMYALEE